MCPIICKRRGDAGAGAGLWSRERDLRLDHLKASGQVDGDDFDKAVGRISFSWIRPFVSSKKFAVVRAFNGLWERITKERYGVRGCQKNIAVFDTAFRSTPLGLTERQPENNVQRIILEMLGVTLSRETPAPALIQLPCWNEALGLPRPWDQQWSLRMQQALAYETESLGPRRYLLKARR